MPWSDWVHLPESDGSFDFGIAASSWTAHRLDCFTVGKEDHALYHMWRGTTGWSNGWESLGGSLIAAPAAVSWGLNRIDAFGIGPDGALCHQWWNGSEWSGFE